MDSTVKVIEFVTPTNKYTIFYYKIPVSFGSPHVFNHLHLFYPVSVILSKAHEFIRRILSSKIRILLHICTSGFVVNKVAI